LLEAVKGKIAISPNEGASGLLGMFFEELKRGLCRVVFQQLNEKGNEVEFMTLKDGL